MKTRVLIVIMMIAAWGCGMMAQTGREMKFQKWALTPPMGWNSWDCYGPTVVESEVKANADYMASHLLDYGWEYVVVDIRWFVENDKAGGYNQTNPKYVIDEYGRYTPAVNRFPSAADGAGFRPLADYVHKKGLKFGIHLMRGLPKEAVARKLPVKGTDGITCDMIASNDSACTWLRDNMKVDWRREGAQEYYNSCFDMYADWGVDFVKIDDLSRPYHTAEIEMIRKAIDRTGRPMVLSVSPGETPLEKVDHVKTHANMWRTVDDFWDNWSQLNYQFGICAKWAPYIAPGTWPDADMLPLGRISIRGERGGERWTNFTSDEQYTLMSLWTIFKSPLMFGGDLTYNDDATNALLTNREVLYMHHHSAANRQLDRNSDDMVTWIADDPATGDRFVALFNLAGSGFVNPKNSLYRSGTISYLTTGHSTDVDVVIPEGSKQLALVVTDGGDGFDSDHADWINPVITLRDGSTVDLTGLRYVKGVTGWGEIHVNSNIEGKKLSVNGTAYDKGLAVHANSVLLYNLPEGAVRFTALAGIDNTGSDQGSKSSVEFLVYNYDPTDSSVPDDEPTSMRLDLTRLGFAPGQSCNIREMWSGKDLGDFKDSEHEVSLRPHQSVLYRVSGSGREALATVSLDVASGEHDSATPFEVTVTVTGAPVEGTYIQLLCDGKVECSMPMEGSGSVSFPLILAPGEHILKAIYSGTASVAAASSQDGAVYVKAAPEDLTEYRNKLVNMLSDAEAVALRDIAGAMRKLLDNAVKTVKEGGDIEKMDKEQLEGYISSLREAIDNARRSMAPMRSLRDMIAEADALAHSLREGDAKTALAEAVADARRVAVGDDTDMEDLAIAAEALKTAIDDARRNGVPAEGASIDVTLYITNPSFEEGTKGWSHNNRYTGWQDVNTWNDRPAADGTSFISVAAGSITSLELFQTIPNLPEGTYTLEGALRNTESAACLTDQRLFATSGTETLYSDRLNTVSGDNNNDWTRLSIRNIAVGKDGIMRIGVVSTGDGKTNHGWFQADDFRLYYTSAPSFVREMPVGADGVTVKIVTGGIEITSSGEMALPVYDLQGVTVAVAQLAPGTVFLPLHGGLYIVNGSAVLIR